MSGSVPTGLRPQHPVPRALSGLADEFGFVVIGEVDGVEITGVTATLDAVQHGDVFVDDPSAGSADAVFAEALESGALAVLATDARGAAAVAAGLPALLTPDPLGAVGAVASWLHRTEENPATVFAAFGGASSIDVARLIGVAFAQLGVDGEVLVLDPAAADDELVSHDAAAVHAAFARLAEEGVRSVGIAIADEALDAHGIAGIELDVIAFGGSSASPNDSVLALFQPDQSRRGVVEVDSAAGRSIVDLARIPVTTVSAVVGSDADWHVVAIDSDDEQRIAFSLEGPEGRGITSSITLEHSILDAAIAIAAVVESGFDLEAVSHSLDRDGGLGAPNGQSDEFGDSESQLEPGER